MMPTPNDAAALLSSVRTAHDLKTARLRNLADDAVFLYQHFLKAGICEEHALELTTLTLDIHTEQETNHE